MSHPAGGRPLSVLVVDDLADAAESLALVLSFHGFAARTAPDGPAALKAAADEPPDVVVTDLRMPGMDGWELARRLRARADTAGAFVVALTGCGSEDDRRRSAEAGVDVHLLKPVAPCELVALLGRLRRPMSASA
jgi:DNA-binding response OmpR family regulator